MAPLVVPQWYRQDWTQQVHSWGPQEGVRPTPVKVNSTKPTQHISFGLWPGVSFSTKIWLVKSSKKQDCSINSGMRLSLVKPHLGALAAYWKARTCAATEAFKATKSSSGLLWESNCSKNDWSRPVNTLGVSCHNLGWEVAIKYQICLTANFDFCLCCYQVSYLTVFSEEGPVGNPPKRRNHLPWPSTVQGLVSVITW